MSGLEELLELQLRATNQRGWLREFKFHPKRRWRMDFANPELMLAVEVEGGIWNGGRHTRGYGFEADLEKYNAATELGWNILRFSGTMVKTGEAINQIERLTKQLEKG